MADPYVIFPGTGDHVSTDDVNLLDADTAHQFQAPGNWSYYAGVTSGDAVDVPAAFAGRGYQYTLAAALGRTGSRNSTNDDAYVAVDPSTEYTFAPTVTITNGGPLDVIVRVLWLDAAKQLIEYDDVTVQVGTDPTVALNTAISSPLSAFMQFDVRCTGTGAGELMTVYDAVFREGSDPTFVPSLRIVKDLDMRADCAFPAIPPAAQSPIIQNYNTNVGYRLYYETNGDVSIRYGNGATIRSATTDQFLLTSNGRSTVRVTVDVSSGVVEWYQDSGNVDSSSIVAGDSVPSGVDLRIGSNLGGTVGLLGTVYSAEVRDGIDGPVVARFDAGDVPQPAQLPI